MSLRWHPAKFAAVTYAFAAVVPIVSWSMLLFDVSPRTSSPVESAMSMLSFTLSSRSPSKWWFVGWALLPLILLTAAAAYLSPLPRERSWSVALFVAGVALTAYALFSAPPLGIVLLFPLYFSFRCIHGA